MAKLTQSPEREAQALRAELELLRGEIKRLRSKANDDGQLHQFINEVPLPYHALDEDGVILDVNKAWLTATGYTMQEVLGKAFVDFHDPATKEEFQERFADFKSRGTITGIEIILICKNDTRILATIDGRIDRFPDGRFHQTHCVWRDTTKERTMAQALARSELKFRHVLEKIQLIGISLDIEGRLSFTNDYFLSLTGWTREEILGRDWFETFLPPAIAEEIRNVFCETLKNHESGEHTFYENDITTRNGSILHVGWTNTLTLDENGSIIDVTCVGIDLTERKRTMVALRDSEDRFRSIIQNSPMGVYLCELNPDDELILIGTNPAADRFTGVDNAPLIGLPVEKAFAQLNDTDLPQRFRRIARDGKPWHTPRFKYNNGAIDGWFEIYAFQTSPLRMAIMFLNIAPQVKAAEALKTSERLHRRLFENAAVGILFATDSGSILDANSLACDILGYERDELRKLSGRDILHPDSIPATSPEAPASRAHDTTSVYRKEKIYRRKDGSRLPVEVHTRTVDAQGNRLITFLDISARKEAERELTDFRRLTDAMSDTMIDMLWSKDVQGRYIFANKAIRNNLLHSDDINVLGKTDIFFAQRQRNLGHRHTFGECCSNSDDLVMNSGKSGRFIEDGEVQGQYLCLEVLKSPLYDEKGQLIGTVGTGRDITEQRQAQEELRRSRSLLEETQRLGDMGGFEMDVRTGESFWTEGEFNTYGLDPHQKAPNVRAFLKAFVHPDDRKALRNAFRRAYTRRASAQSEFRAHHSDGSQRIIRFVIAPSVDENGNVPRIIGVTRDVTQEKAAQSALLAAKDSAENASRSKSEFLANMSHELRTPLNGIFGMLQLAQTTELNPEQQEYIDTALATGRSLLTVINDVLDFSRLDAGFLQMNRDPFDLRRTVAMVMDNFRVPALEKGISIQTSVGEDIPLLLLGDDARLRQILFNLVGNAVKFCLEGTVSLEIHALPTNDRDLMRLLFTVTDTGIGIPEKFLETIFEAFTQVDGAYTRKFKGTGLGLGIVKRLIGLMSGNLSISSEPGKGTQVHFTLPFGFLAKQEPRKEPQTLAHCPTSKPLSILLAEDDMVNQLVARITLEKQGHKVTCATTGLEALKAVQNQNFDCILMDIQMPEMDGLTAADRIHELRPGLPIIAMTAYAMKGDRDRFLEAGLDAYIAKPVDVMELAKTLADLSSDSE